MKKRLMALAAASMLCLATTCICGPQMQAYAESVTVSSEAELADVLSDGPFDTVTLGSNITLTGQLRVPNNVELDLNGKTVSSSADYAFAITGAGAKVKNGTLSGTGIRSNASSATGSAVQGLTIKNAPLYGVYVTGTLGSIQNCTIDGAAIGINVQGGTVTGAISGNTVSGCKDSSHGSVYLVNGAKVKGKIANNTIKNGKSHGIHLFSKASCGNIEKNTIAGCADRAILITGEQKSSSNDGSWSGNISGNTITKCKGHGISIYHGSHVGKITGNKLDTIGGKNNGGIGDYGITVNSGTPYYTYASEITNNTLKNVTYASIVVFSEPENDKSGKCRNKAYISGDIAFNKVYNSGTYKKGANWSNSKLPCQGAIYVDDYARVKGNIHHNTISTSYDNGINVLSNSNVKNIYSNKITNAKNAGIAVVNGSVVSGAIYKNTVKKSGIYGVFVNSKSKVKGKVRNNTIANAGQNGVFVGNGASVATVSNNTITGAGLYGVIAGGKGKITTLLGNRVSVNNAKKGIAIISNTSCYIKTIRGNKLSGKYSCGIRVKSPTGKVKVTSNTLKSGNPKKVRCVGISVEKCKKGITITSNKITGNNTAPGIYVKSSKSTIKKNVVTKSTKKVSK